MGPQTRRKRGKLLAEPEEMQHFDTAVVSLPTMKVTYPPVMRRRLLTGSREEN